MLARAYEATPAEAMDYDFARNVAWVRARDLLLEFGAESDVAICDVGCHTGLFLDGLPARFRRHGVESSRDARKRAMARGVRLVGRRIDDVDGGLEDRFDVITMFDVFEHLVRPLEELERVLAWLRPGGILLLSTGDMDRFVWKIAAGHHWYLQTPLHISLGSARFFRGLAEHLPVRLLQRVRLAHQEAGTRELCGQWLEFVHWQCLRRGGLFRVPQRLIQHLPGRQRLAHRQTVPWTMGLPDHGLFVLERR